MSAVESADLILKLYDLRREKKMRKARNWVFAFNPKDADDYLKTMMDPDVGPYLRMVTSYWDMAAAFVNRGAIDGDLFDETAGEHYIVFAKVEPILAELRERFQNPRAFSNLEKHIMSRPDGPQRLRKTQEWMQGLAAQQSEKASA